MFDSQKDKIKTFAMSDSEVVVEKAKGFTNREQDSIHDLFEMNANFFSANNSHHSEYIKKLFDLYNKNFSKALGVEFNEKDLGCEDCKNHLIKFWSFIVYDIWQKEIR